MHTKNHRPGAAERRWIAWLAERPCANCGDTPVTLHHAVGAAGKHNRVHIGHYWQLPLCWACHQGPEGIHQGMGRIHAPARKTFEKAMFIRLAEAYGGIPDNVFDAIASY